MVSADKGKEMFEGLGDNKEIPDLEGAVIPAIPLDADVVRTKEQQVQSNGMVYIGEEHAGKTTKLVAVELADEE